MPIKKSLWQRILTPSGLLIAFATLILALIGEIVTATHAIDTEIDAQSSNLNGRLYTLETAVKDANIQSNFQSLRDKQSSEDQRIAKLQSAVEVLNSKQSKNTQDLINHLLAAAQNTKPKEASQLIGTATSLISVLHTEKQPSAPKYFTGVVAQLKTLGLRGDLSLPAFEAVTALAAYRSSLEMAPRFPNTLPQKFVFLLHPNSGIRNLTINATNVATDIIQQTEPHSNVWVKHVTIVSGNQTIDGIRWDDVTFVGTHVRYANGDIYLKSVHFVNCTFDFVPGSRAAYLASLISLNPEIPYLAPQPQKAAGL